MTRGTEKKLLQSHSNFESVAEMISKACDPVRPTFVKRLAKNSNDLDEVYKDLYHDFRMYKSDVNDPDDFNSKDEHEKDKYEHNDSWMDSIKEKYYDLAEKADAKLEELSAGGQSQVEEKAVEMQEAKDKEVLKIRKLVEDQLQAEKKAIADSVTVASNTVISLPDSSIGTVQGQAIRSSLYDINTRMDFQLQKLLEQLLGMLDDKEEENFRRLNLEFIGLQRARIDSIEMAIVAKAKEMPAAGGHGQLGAGHSGSGKTYLRKVDPPKFNGDILEFPEFKRKWTANVTREKMEEDSELDRLRDNVPESARKMLIGEKSLANAWKILTKMFGNKTMLANKLKGKLKTIKTFGKEDHDVVINLAIEVKSIIKSLAELNMQEMLKYDDEYLSAIYRALPSKERDRWLNFDKDQFGTEWEAMEAFLEEIREKATNSKILLSNYAAQDTALESIKCKRCHKIGHKKADCSEPAAVNIALTKTKKVNSDDDDDSRISEQKERIRKLCGKCPLCKGPGQSCHPG